VYRDQSALTRALDVLGEIVENTMRLAGTPIAFTT